MEGKWAVFIVLTLLTHRCGAHLVRSLQAIGAGFWQSGLPGDDRDKQFR